MFWRRGKWREWLAQVSRGRIRPMPRRKVRLTLLAKMEGIDAAAVDTLRELVSTGERFERLTASPDWSAFVELKEELQAIATEEMRSRSASDQQRRDGVQAYWALEGLFGAVYRTIRNGQKARQLIQASIKQEA